MARSRNKISPPKTPPLFLDPADTDRRGITRITIKTSNAYYSARCLAIKAAPIMTTNNKTATISNGTRYPDNNALPIAPT